MTTLSTTQIRVSTPTEAALLRSSFKKILEREAHLGRRFYEHLFRRHPEMTEMFKPERRSRQEKMFALMLVTIMDRIDDVPWLHQELSLLGQKHAGITITDEMYAAFGQALLDTFGEILGSEWAEDVETAWRHAYEGLAARLKLGATQR
jgi:nitric oxide dioxygenase